MTFGLPPSVNALYQKRRGGQVALTDEAREFREKVKRVVVDNLHRIKIPLDQETVYEFTMRAYFEKLENPGWFETWGQDTYVARGKNKGQLLGKAGERKAQSRYKRIDVDNRIKFLQDCVIKSVGIMDDCQVFRTVLEKYESSHPRTEVTIRVIPWEQFFKPKLKKAKCKCNFQPCDNEGWRCIKCGSRGEQMSGGL